MYRTNHIFSTWDMTEYIFTSWFVWLAGLSVIYIMLMLKANIRQNIKWNNIFMGCCAASSLLNILICLVPAFALVAWGMNISFDMSPKKAFAFLVAFLLLFGPFFSFIISLIIQRKDWNKIGLSIAYSPYLAELCLMLYMLYNIYIHYYLGS